LPYMNIIPATVLHVKGYLRMARALAQVAPATVVSSFDAVDVQEPPLLIPQARATAFRDAFSAHPGCSCQHVL
jgi:hypothetical protein